jgi:lipooligosaccharide transport system permease protein
VIERPALEGILVRELYVFSKLWRSAAITSVAQPIIYLLAFGLGFGSLVSHVGGLTYVQYVGIGTVAVAVLFGSVFSGIYTTLLKWKYQRTYDAFLAAPVDVVEIVTAEASWIAARASLYGCAPLLVSILFGLDPAPGMLLVPFIGLLTGFGFACGGIVVAAITQNFDNTSYVQSLVITPMFLLGGTFFPIDQLPEWAQTLSNLNPLYHCVQLVRHACLGFEAVDLFHVAVLSAFGAVFWLLAVRWLRRRLID